MALDLPASIYAVYITSIILQIRRYINNLSNITPKFIKLIIN